MNIKTIVFSVFAFFGVMNNALAGPLCALAPAGHNPRLDQPASRFAADQMRLVSNFLCGRFRCPQFSFHQNPTIQNAMAWSDQTDSIIRYNAGFMNRTARSYGNFAAIGIFAHELGHIIDFSQNQGQIPQPQREATADRYAGCVFALAGHPESDLLSLARSLHAMGASPGYPTPAERVQLVRIGYRQCR